MTTDDKITDEKLQHDINRGAAKISSLLSVKMDKYEYLASEYILLSGQSRIIGQAKFTWSLLARAWDTQTKAIKDAAEK